MNSLNFVGNLGGDAEIRYTKAGKPVTQFSAAMDSGWGERKTTTWVRCTMWGDRGVAVAPYLLKGQKVAVTGEASMSEWTAKDGTIKSSFECNVGNVTLVGEKKVVASTPQEPHPVTGHQPAAQEPFKEDEDIPF